MKFCINYLDFNQRTLHNKTKMYTSNIIWFLLILITSSELAQVLQAPIKCNKRTLLNGSVKLKKKGTFAHHICKKGFILVGQRYINCVKGKWEAEPPVCVKSGCSPINTSNFNGTAIETFNGALIYINCNPGFDIIGNNFIHCDGKKWSSDLPTCTETGKNPKTSCDFETDLCGWTHSLNHDFDWKRQNYKTPSGHLQTGPSYDHTKGSGKDGYYMYIESVSQEEDDHAMLISPIYDKMYNGFCFRFYYHMFGTGIGTLRVYIRKENDSPTILKLQPLFIKSGNQGDRWIEEIITVDKTDKPFQIIIEGVRGESIVSDIAIDDVELFDKDQCPQTQYYGSTDVFENTTLDERSFESCLNRCDKKLEDQSCDCHEGCIELNSCCPDYKPLCVFDDNEFTDTTETDIPTSTTKENIDKESTSVIFTGLQNRSIIPTKNIESTTQKIISVVPQKPVVLTQKPVVITEKPVVITQKPVVITQKPVVITQKPVVITQKPVVITQKPVVITQKPVVITQKPVVVIQKPVVVTQKPGVITQKPGVITQKPVVITQKSVPFVPQKTVPIVPQKPIPFVPQKIVPIVPQKPVPMVPQKPVPMVPQKPVPMVPQKPVPMVPQKPVSIVTKKPIGIVTKSSPVKNPFVTKTPQIPNITIKVPDPKVYKTIKPTKSNEVIKNDVDQEDIIQPTILVETDFFETESLPENEKNMLASTKKKETYSINLTMIIVGSIVLVVMITILVVVVKRYGTRFKNFRNYGTTRSDSLSDVRFLTSDEMLDFTIQRSDL